MLLQVTGNEIRARYAVSVLGAIWILLYPLLFLGVYAIIYLVVFGVRFEVFNSYEYVALIFCGLIPFLGFSEAVGTGVSSITSSSSLIKNTLFPIELLPVKVILVSFVTQVVGTGLLLVALGILGRLGIWALMLPVIWLLQMMFTIGVVWVLSSINVYMRDLQNMIAIVLLLLMMVSPIAYTVDMVPGGLRPFIGVNPLFYLIISYQNIFMYNQFPGWEYFGILIGISFFMFYFGYWFFTRMKRALVDNL
jgi:lipopolysaccharide transport system permease protein